jgi:hypothetical protein
VKQSGRTLTARKKILPFPGGIFTGRKHLFPGNFKNQSVSRETIPGNVLIFPEDVL